MQSEAKHLVTAALQALLNRASQISHFVRNDKKRRNDKKVMMN